MKEYKYNLICIDAKDLVHTPHLEYGKLYQTNDENDTHYVINGTGWYKTRFMLVPKKILKSKLWQIVTE